MVFRLTVVFRLTAVFLHSEEAAEENRFPDHPLCSQAPRAGNNSEHVEYASSHHVGDPLHLGCARIIARRLAGPESNTGSVGLCGHERERTMMVEENVGL